MKRLLHIVALSLAALSLAPALAADLKISQLTGASTLDGSETVPVVQGGANRKATTQQIGDVAGMSGPGEMLRLQYGNGPGGTVTNLGWIENASGSTGTPAIATTNRLTRTTRATRITGATAGSEAFSRTDAIVSRDATFTFGFRGGIEVAAGSTTRLFIGGRASTSNPGNVDPSSFVSMIGIGADAADANLQFMHNDASGTAVKVDTGIAKTAGDGLAVEIDCTASLCSVTLNQFAGTNLTATPTATYSTTVSTELPTASTLLAMYGWISNGSTASAATLARSRQMLRTPF